MTTGPLITLGSWRIGDTKADRDNAGSEYVIMFARMATENHGDGRCSGIFEHGAIIFTIPDRRSASGHRPGMNLVPERHFLRHCVGKTVSDLDRSSATFASPADRVTLFVEETSVRRDPPS